MEWLAAWASQGSLHIAGGCYCHSALCNHLKCRRKLQRNYCVWVGLWLHRLPLNSCYWEFWIPGTTGSFSLSGASFLMTEVLYFPKRSSWMAIWPHLSPLQKLRFSSRVGHVYVKVMQRNIVPEDFWCSRPCLCLCERVSENLFWSKSSSLVSFMVCPQATLVCKYWWKHFVSSIEISSPPVVDISWNQQLLTKQSPHHTDDIRQRSFLGQSAGQQLSSAGETRRWECKIKVILEIEKSSSLCSTLYFYSAFFIS